MSDDVSRRTFLGAAAALTGLPDSKLEVDDMTPGEGPPEREGDPAWTKDASELDVATTIYSAIVVPQRGVEECRGAMHLMMDAGLKRGAQIRFGDLRLRNTRGKNATVWAVNTLPDQETIEYVNAAAFKTATELFEWLKARDPSSA